MSDSPSTTRIELHEDSMKVVFTDHQSLHRDMRDQGLFERLGKRKDDASDPEQKLLTSLYASMNYRGHTVRVATARRFDGDEPQILPDSQNLSYCEAEITEREPTPAEKEPYEDAFMDCPSPVYEFELPPLRKFKNPHVHDEFTTAIRNPKELETIAEKLQRKVEHGKWLHQKTSYTGSKTNLLPEWNPNSESMNGDKVKGGAKQKYYTATELWDDIIGVSYREWFAARLYVLGRTERKLDTHGIVALELVEESEGESYCQYCGNIDNKSAFLHIPDKRERERRVCENCADAWSDFSDEEVLAAKNQ